MKIKVITDSGELEQFTSRKDITISKIDVRSCEQSFFAQQYFVAVVMYEESTSDNFDWQPFRTEAAKDILCHLLDRYTGDSDNKGFVTQAIGIADELIKQLKEKEEK